MVPVTDSAKEAPIVVKVNITRAELIELRRVALDRNMSPPALIAETLRATFDLTGGTS